MERGESGHPGGANAVAGGNQGTYQNMFNALKANTEPDLAQVEFDMLPSPAPAGSARHLQRLEPDAGDRFIGFAWDQATFGGEGVFAIPQDTGPMAMFYRKDLFERYGIQVPKTWDEFRVAAEEVHRKDPSVYLTSFPQRDVGWFEGLAWQHGASWFNTEGSTGR